MLFLLGLPPCPAHPARQAKADSLGTRTRIFVLTDISTLSADEGEPDDTQSLIRLLLMSDKFNIEGIAATYTSHGRHLYPEYPKEVIRAYAVSYPNLTRHSQGFANPDSLLAKVTFGSGRCGTDRIGKGHDTPASRALENAVRSNPVKPLWVLVWGAPTDLAQALWSLREECRPEEERRLLANLHVYAIGDQYDKSGPWIRSKFPQLDYITDYSNFRGMYRGGDTTLVSSEWVRDNIHSSSAPLARLYPDYNGGDPWGKVRGIKEGDSPSFLYLIYGEPSCRDFHPVKYRKRYQRDFSERINWLTK